MGTYYVRATGSDTTGDGSTGNPWASISKALTTISIAGGHTVYAGDGTYGENTSSTGYFYLNRAFVSEVIVASENGVAANVVIQSATSTSFTVRLSGIRNLHFQNVSFISRTTSNPNVIKCQDGATAYAGLKFTNCVFTSKATTANYDVLLSNITLVGADITFTDCQFTRTGSATMAVYITGTASAGQSVVIDGGSIGPVEGGYNIAGIDTVTITDIVGIAVGNSSIAFRVANCLNLTLTDADLLTTGTGMVACLIGDDATTGGTPIAGIVRGGRFRAIQSHGMLIGNAADGVNVYGATVYGGDQGIVFKGAVNSNAIGCDVTLGGVGHALYFKGATNCIFRDCVARVPNSGYALAIAEYTATNCQFIGNRVLVSGAGSIFQWSDAADGGGNICDYNGYYTRGTTVNGWGRIKGVDVSSLAMLQAAWAGYGDGSNDSHSWTWNYPPGPGRGILAGGRL